MRAELGEFPHTDIGNPAHRGGQMTHRGIPEDLGRDGGRGAGVLEQLGRAGDTGQIDDTLEVGGTAGTELPGEMFAAHPEATGDLFGPKRCFNIPDDQVPGAQLQWFGEPQYPWPVGEQAAALRRQRGPAHEFPGHRIVHPLDDQCSDPALPARGQGLPVVGPERGPGHHRQRRQVLTDIAKHGEAGAEGRKDDGIEETTGGQAPKGFGPAATRQPYARSWHRATKNGAPRPRGQHSDDGHLERA